MEAELTEKLTAVTQEKQQLTGKLDDTRNLLKELESKYKKDTSNLAEKARYSCSGIKYSLTIIFMHYEKLAGFQSLSTLVFSTKLVST